MIPQVRFIKRTYGYDNIEVTLEDGFKTRLLFAAHDKITEKLDEPFIIEMAENRREVRKSFTDTENRKGELYYGSKEGSNSPEAGLQSQAEEPSVLCVAAQRDSV